MTAVRKMLAIDAMPGFPVEIGRWLWAMEEVRRHTGEIVQGLGLEALDWQGPGGGENSIGTLLYHIAIVEMDWLYFDIRDRGNFPGPAGELFPVPMRTDRRLTPIPGVPLADHMERLDRSRRIFLNEMASMTIEDWRRARSPVNADYSVTPEWVVFHLVEHEAWHADQMRFLKGLAADAALT